MISFRQMNEDDIAAGLSLCRAVGWNQLARDWEIFLKLNRQGCLVAENNNIVIGTVTAMRYQSSLSWIGMVLVNPLFRGQGLGTKLLGEILKSIPYKGTIKLDATSAGREVYKKLNFVDQYRICRMEGIASVKTGGAFNIRPIQPKDLDAIANFDHAIFGADRSELLQLLFEGAPHLAFMIKEGNNILGYCFGRNGYQFMQVGPIVAINNNVAKELAIAALKSCVGQQVILDVITLNDEWINWLISIGFTEQRSFMRMCRGTNIYPDMIDKQFAIVGPESG
ncbi:MAG: GNAT family N-acetyltransferase [Ginsengibacter sp.]